VLLSGANVHDKKMAMPVVDAIPGIRGSRGRPRRRPKKLHADKAYDYADVRRDLRKGGMIPRIARRGIESSQRLGRSRWVVERTIAWLHGMKRLRIREERRDDIHLALVHLGCSIILLRRLMQRRKPCRS
jgi:IS5 family transposase